MSNISFTSKPQLDKKDLSLEKIKQITQKIVKAEKANFVLKASREQMIDKIRQIIEGELY